MSTSTLMSATEFAALDSLDQQRVELARGEIIPMSPVSLKHSVITARLIFYLQSWINAGAGGFVGTELGFILGEHTIRAADVYYLSPEQCSTIHDHDEFWQGAPTLAVEVISPTERATDIEQKIGDYLAANTPLIWIIYPRLQTVHVIRPNQPRHVLRLEDELSDVVLLPGFILPLQAIFA